MSSDGAHILDMLLAARRAREALQDMSLDQLTSDWRAQSIVQHQLMLLGEAVKRLSPEFRERHNQVQWSSIAGHRDILIHRYDMVDIGEVWRIVTREIPPLIEFLASIAPEEEHDA